MKPIFVTKPTLPPLEDLIPYLEQIWKNKILTNGGPFHSRLEEELCDYLGVPYISLFSNGTIALITALKALKTKGEVITTPFSFVATSHALVWNGLKPVFVDIDPSTLNLNPLKIEAAITTKTSAIMPTHVYGTPCDVEAIDSIAKKHNLKVIYDSSHAFGVSKDTKSILNFGDLSVLSFHATKVFNTFEGGAIVCSDLKTKNYIDNLKNFGFMSETSVVQVGINGKMNEFNASIGLLQLKNINKDISERKLISDLYKKYLKSTSGIRCYGGLPNWESNYSYFPIFVDENYVLSRDELYQKLKNNGIYSRRYFYPLITSFPVYKNHKRLHKLEVAEEVARKVLCLPIYPSLTKNHVQKIVNIINN